MYKYCGMTHIYFVHQTLFQKSTEELLSTRLVLFDLILICFSFLLIQFSKSSRRDTTALPRPGEG